MFNTILSISNTNKDPINRFNTGTCLRLSESEFPTPYVVDLLVGLRLEVVILLVGLRLEVVIHFCWYWWNCWLLLFICSFHNENKKRHEYFEPLQNNEWSLFQKRVVRTKFDIYIFIVKKPDFSKSKLKDVRYRSWYNINKQYKPKGQSRMNNPATMAT